MKFVDAVELLVDRFPLRQLEGLRYGAIVSEGAALGLQLPEAGRFVRCTLKLEGELAEAVKAVVRHFYTEPPAADAPLFCRADGSPWNLDQFKYVSKRLSRRRRLGNPDADNVQAPAADVLAAAALDVDDSGGQVA